jgi:cell wall-associated NlpC family hydrolase
MHFDPRLTPARPDLAAAYLQGQVEAARYSVGTSEIVRACVVNLYKEPVPDAPIQTQALFGEEVIIYDEAEGWAWGQLKSDGYVGYMSHLALGPLSLAPTHRVIVPTSFLYPAATIKATPVQSLPMGALVHVMEIKERFARLDYVGWVWLDHLAPLDHLQTDYVACAHMCEHAPYLWGGRTQAGIDCSGLVQLALAQAGVKAPRDTDMQQAALGYELEPAQWQSLQRGDLVFWKGHIGMMQDHAHMLHASGHHMRVVSEPLSQARQRILAQTGADIALIKRLPSSP